MARATIFFFLVVAMCIYTVQAGSNTNDRLLLALNPEGPTHDDIMASSYENGLTFYHDFENELNAPFAKGDNRITNPMPGFIFTDGIAGRGLVISEEKKSPLPEYSTDRNITAQSGTIAFWFKPDKSIPGALPGNRNTRYFLSSRAKDWRFYLYCNYDSIAFDYYANVPINHWSAENWHHIAIQWDNKGIKFFLDGKLSAQKDIQPNWKRLWQIGHTFTLGGYRQQHHCNGVYDELIIWDRALEPPEIKKLYTIGQSHRPFSTLINKKLLKSHTFEAKNVRRWTNIIENGSFEAGANNQLLINIPARISPSHPSFVTQRNHQDRVQISNIDAYHGRNALLLNIEPKFSNTMKYHVPRQGTATLRTLAYRLDPKIKYTFSLQMKVLSPDPVSAGISLDAMRPLEKPPAKLKYTRKIPGNGKEWIRLEAGGFPFKAHNDLYRLRVDIINIGTGKASILIDAIQINPVSSIDSRSKYYYDEAITATLQTKKLANIYDFSKPVILHAIVANQDEQAAKGTLDVNVYDLWNRQIYQQQIVQDMAGLEIDSIQINAGIINSGLYRATIARSDSSTIIDEITFSVLPETRQLDTLGIHATHDDYTLTVAKRLGTGWNRLWDNGRPTDWANVQPQSETEFKWDYSDSIINHSLDHGFNLLGLIAWPQSKWAVNWTDHSRPHWLHTRWGNNDKAELPAEIFYNKKFRKQWLSYVEKVVTRYKEKITYWELLNEPYLHASPQWVVDVYQATVPVIRAANPDAVIVGPCLHLRPEWANKLIGLGILQYVDVFSYHGYHLGGEELEQIHKWAGADNIERPVFDTENSALSSSQFFCASCQGKEFSGHVSPQESALRMTKTLVSALGEGTDTFFYYWMVHYDAYEKHGTFLDHMGGLRSSAVAYALTGWRLRNLEPKRKQDHSGGLRSYIFANRDDTRAVAVLWPADNQKLPALKVPENKDIAIYDIMGARINDNLSSHPALEIAGMPIILETDSVAKLQQRLSQLLTMLPDTH